MDKSDLILEINELLIQEYGIPERAEKPPDPLDLLIATILSQNTNDNNSYKAYVNLKSKINDYSDIIDMKISDLEELIRTAGLTKQKARAIRNFLISLKEKYKQQNLEFIRKYSDEIIINLLTEIEGIGVKTASCVLMFSLHRDICPVDTHVHRLVNRLSVVNSKTADNSFFKLNENFPKNIAHSFHTNLIKHGRKICRPKEPFCGDCALYRICTYKEKSSRKLQIITEERLLLLDKI